MSKYIVADGKSISTKAGIITEKQEVKEELLNGNAKALLEKGIIKELNAKTKDEETEEKAEEKKEVEKAKSGASKK
jgi:hypothetical protein